MKKVLTSVDSQRTLSKPLAPQKNACTDRSPFRGAGTGRRSEYGSKEGYSSWDATPASRCSPWDPQARIDNLPSGKREVMDKFFTPVHNTCHEEPKTREHYNYVPHHSHHHQHHQDNEGHGYSTPGSSSGSASRGHVHRHHHGLQTPEHPDRPQDGTRHHGSPHHSRCSGVSPHSRSHHPDPVASSSRSYSCTSSSSSWSSEASIDKEAFLTDGQPGPRYSQSCGSISVEGQRFWDGDERADLEGRENRHPKHQHCQGAQVRKLHRSHSKSDEVLPHTNSRENTGPLPLDHSPLYKSASLGRSLAFNDYTEVLLDSEVPKKAPSSIQLPSKSILKNRQGQGGAAGGVSHVRKAKSLEVLSTHVEVTAGGLKVDGLGTSKMEDADMEKRKEAVRQNFVQEKLQFSAFLNEITRQVISPSHLNSLGVPDAFGPPSPGQASQKSPRKEQRAEGERQEGGRAHGQPKDRSGSPESVVSSSHSHSSKFSHSSKRHHRHRRPVDGTSQQQHHTLGDQTDISTYSLEPCPPPGNGQGNTGEKQHQGGYNLLLTDGTTTSPELSPCVARRHHSRANPHPEPLPHRQKHHQPHPEKYHHQRARRSPSPHSPCAPKTTQTSHKDTTHSGVLGQESDSSQNKDTASTTSTSVENSDKNKQICQNAAAMQHKEAVADVNRAQCLQEQNEELRRSLLQTAVRMECMEVELRKTQAELSCVKDSFNRLQENDSSAQQSNELLEQKLQTTVLTMGAEQKCLTQRISELSKELTAAHATILSLKTVNIPSLLQDLLDQLFQSKEAATESLLPATVSTQLKDTVLDRAPPPGGSQSHALAREGEGSEGSQQRDTTFQTPKQREQGHQTRPERGQTAGGDAASQLDGGKEAEGCLSTYLLIPHLQLTPQQTYPSDTLRTPAGAGRGVIEHQLGSPFDLLSVGPEESNPSGNQQRCYQDRSPDKPGPAAAKSTGAPQNVPPPEGGDHRDSEEDEIISEWRLRNSKGKVGVSRNRLENDAATVTYQAAQRMLDNFIRHLQPPGEREDKGSARGLASGAKEESLNGEGKPL